MKPRFIVLWAALLAAFPIAADSAPTGPFLGRVSFEDSTLLLRGQLDSAASYALVNTPVMAGDQFWVDRNGVAEIEALGGTYVALADASTLQVESVAVPLRFTLGAGHFYVYRQLGSTGACILDTPACRVEIDANSLVRIDVEAIGGTTVTVRGGIASVSANGFGATRARAGERISVDAGLLPSKPFPFNALTGDSFDRWALQRYGFLAQARTVPRRSDAVNLLGGSTLALYGDWLVIDGRTVWRPSAYPGFVPYRSGSWVFVPGYGYQWVGSYPFSYVTTHFGYWFYDTSYGWLWYYAAHWRPAFAVTIWFGDYFLWAPMGIDGLPVVPYPSQVIVIAGVDFDVTALTYVPVRNVLDGCAYVQPYSPDWFRWYETDRVRIWNPSTRETRRHEFAWQERLAVEQYPPPRIARGPLRTDRTRQAAPLVVHELERATAPIRSRVAEVDADTTPTRVRPIERNIPTARVGIDRITIAPRPERVIPTPPLRPVPRITRQPVEREPATQRAPLAEPPIREPQIRTPQPRQPSVKVQPPVIPRRIEPVPIAPPKPAEPRAVAPQAPRQQVRIPAPQPERQPRDSDTRSGTRRAPR